jgi:hypothetical protein
MGRNKDYTGSRRTELRVKITRAKHYMATYGMSMDKFLDRIIDREDITSYYRQLRYHEGLAKEIRYLEQELYTYERNT